MLSRDSKITRLNRFSAATKANRAKKDTRIKLSVEHLEARWMLAAPQFLAGRVMGNVESSAIVEASGLVASRKHANVLWTHNDNGDSKLYALNAQGKHLGVYSTGVTARDWEDIAIGPGPQAGISYLYMADTGDNSQVRTGITVFRVPEPSVKATQSPVNVNLAGTAAINLRYPDGAHDAETLIVDPANGDIYIITKRDARSLIYRAAYPQSTSATTTLTYMGQLTFSGALGGDISPDGDEIIIKDFDDAFYYPRPAGTSITSALLAAPTEIPYTTQELGEGLTFDGQGRGYFANSEGVNQPLYYYERVTDPPGTVEFAVIGDYGVNTANELAVANMVKSWDPSFVVTVGDNNYDTGSAATIDANIGKYYQEFIGNYVGTYGPGSVTDRFFPALGNHDWSTPDAQPYLNYFTLPGNERYYDFVRGPVHFFALDSDPKEPDGITSSSVQARWLQTKLASSTAPFQVVYLHHAPYSSSSSHGSTPAVQWPFKAWGADVVLAGHDHTYERLNIDGLPYIVNGLGGRSLYGFGTPLAGSQVRYNANYGAMLVSATAQSMTLEFRSIAGGGTVVDRFTILPSTPSNPGSLIPTGSTWKYSDTGVNLGTAWRAVAFNDSAWAEGPAQLGYGDGDEATVVSYGSNANSKRITTYFRRSFNVTNPNQYGALSLRLLRDDGAVVYLNGQEVARSNMPSGTIAYSTLASSAVASGAPESTYHTFSIDPARLVSGTNVLAVEIHQSSATSSDLSFDLGLDATLATATPTLVASGSAWKYLDSGANLGTNWRSSTYSDTAWKTGAAPLGYGDGDEATIVSFGPSATNKPITTYFRRTFSVADRSVFTGLTLELQRDDGAVVYLNGQEVARSNMPSGTVAYSTRASSAVGGASESTFYSFTVNPALLLNGTNLLAVEIHQSSPSSSDISFDLRLTGTTSSAAAPAAVVAAAHPLGAKTTSASNPPEGKSVENRRRILWQVPPSQTRLVAIPVDSADIASPRVRTRHRSTAPSVNDAALNGRHNWIAEIAFTFGDESLSELAR
jgi:tartrate-resistant acid phosphatase type 5